MEQVRKVTDALYDDLHAGQSTAQSCVDAANTCLQIIHNLDLVDAGPYVQQQLEDLVEKYELISKSRVNFNDRDEEQTYSRYCAIQILHCNSRLLDILGDLRPW